jgi:HlyD family secretion protein
MKRGWIGGAVLVAGALAWVLLGWKRNEGDTYRFVTVERGDVESMITSTGILQATTTVQVGTQVSGQIAEIYVDFNDRVEKDQLVARIDPTILEQEVEAAEASVERAQAELGQAERDLQRIQRLYEGKVTTDSEHSAAVYRHAVAKASLKSARIGLERAQRNLRYTEIRAPIEGVVLERTVDVGQTVAASLSAPQLFLIAEDLSQMEILASVDESDIGRIHPGQDVRFSVQAYPDEWFSGRVSQVRLQSTIQENVVTYSVVVAVENPDGRLLPGMTATVECVVERAAGVFRVPNAALRFRPTDDMKAAVLEERGGDRVRGEERGERGSGERASRALLWTVDSGGRVGTIPVREGITDGQYTAVTGEGLEEGMQVVAAVTAKSASRPVNPFESAPDDRSRRRGPGF